MRILFLHEVNYLTKPIFEMHEFPEHLARLGHEVGFVHFPEGYTQSQIRELGARKRIVGRVVEGVELDLFTPWTFGGGLLGRLLAAVSSYWQFRRILRDYQPDVVVSFSVPTSGWQALIASRRASVPYVFRAIDVSHKIRKGAFSAFVRKSEKFIYKHADALSANNPEMLRYCVHLGGRNRSATVDLPPINLSHFENKEFDVCALKVALGIEKSDSVILYMGSFFYFSGLPEVIESMRWAPANLKLVLVGGGEQDLELRERVEVLGLQGRIKFAGFATYADLPGVLKLADVALNPMQPSLVSHTAFPNKVLQYLASGKPVVSTRLKGLEATFPKSPALRFADGPHTVVDEAINMIEGVIDSEEISIAAIRLVADSFDVGPTVQGFESKLLKTIHDAD